MAGAAVVTGAGTGIGAAVARRLDAAGFGLVLSGRRREPLERVASALASAVVVAGDVGDPAHADELAAAARERFGGLDAVVNNAGIGASRPAGEDTPAGWEATLRTNLTGAFLVTRAALPQLVERHGALVNVASVNAVRAGPGWASYCVSKAGLVMLAQSVANDYGPLGVRANAVLPGWVRTPMGDEDMDALAERRGVDREEAYRLAHA
jgi:NAD(P)-dependent dehydrogenase (short-subunit alcohol dehydrogenase family)